MNQEDEKTCVAEVRHGKNDYRLCGKPAPVIECFLGSWQAGDSIGFRCCDEHGKKFVSIVDRLTGRAPDKDIK